MVWLTIEQQLCDEFRIKDLYRAKQILVLLVAMTDDAISIDQKRYIEELFEKFNLLDCNPVPK